ncbi:MAG: MFS transporter, partial [Candidatus Dormibacteria bacterium]
AIAAIGAIVFVAIIPLAGRALDAFGSRNVLASGAAFTAIGLGLFGLEVDRLPLAIAGIVVAGIGFGALLGAPTRYIVTNEVPGTLRATGVGLLSIFLIIGQIVGGSLAGGIVGDDLVRIAGYRSAYEAFAIVAVLALIATIALKPRAAERAGATSG